MKKIIDSVHGTIFIDNSFFEHIIDTELFQRLRRVEQSSIRSIFPSARHDRFVHSLGVFHIGLMIERQIRRENKNHNYNWYGISGKPENSEQEYKKIAHSYLVACLLHDIAHAPFSHTFEKYYGTKESLCELLSDRLTEGFRLDITNIDDINYHEYASAYVAITEFSNAIECLQAKVELVARMITGVKFSDNNLRYNQIANGFISLLHGDVIDADRLDYACRDVWASGYATSAIDVQRMVMGIHFQLENGRYELCFRSNVLNEIESVINVKDFQMKNVIHHHTVEYEQDLLKRAAEEMALHLFPEVLDGEKALKQIISIPSVIGQCPLPPDSKHRIKHITDDDLIYLIKDDENNSYYKEWASRQFEKFALWKTRDEFYAYFGDIIPWGIDITEASIRPIVERVIVKYGYDPQTDLRIIKVTFKDRVKLDDLNVFIGGKVVKYSQLYYNKHSLLKNEEQNKPIETIFCFVYLQKNKNISYRNKEFLKEKKKLIADIKEEIKINYPQTKIIDKAQMISYLVKGEHSELLRTILQGKAYPCKVQYEGAIYDATAEREDKGICFDIKDVHKSFDVDQVNGIAYDKSLMTEYLQIYDKIQ